MFYNRLFSEITVGVIAECAFGIKFDDLSGKDSEFLQQATILLGSPEDEAMLTSYYMLLPCITQNLSIFEIVRLLFSIFLSLLLVVKYSFVSINGCAVHRKQRSI